jgi:hypothetical protein
MKGDGKMIPLESKLADRTYLLYELRKEVKTSRVCDWFKLGI